MKKPHEFNGEGNEYSGKVKNVPVPVANGYPNNIPNTQTVQTRGFGAATKGTKSSSKLG